MRIFAATWSVRVEIRKTVPDAGSATYANVPSGATCTYCGVPPRRRAAPSFGVAELATGVADVALAVAVRSPRLDSGAGADRVGAADPEADGSRAGPPAVHHTRTATAATATTPSPTARNRRRTRRRRCRP